MRIGIRRMLPSLVGHALLVGLISSAAAQTVGIFRDEGGAVFNVRAYGALGNGTTNDQPAIQQAITAAVSAGGGVVYFPAGNYLITSTLTNSRGDLVSLVGAGMGSVLDIGTSVGVAYPPIAVLAQFHGATIAHMKFVCKSMSDTAVQTTDIVSAPFLNDLTISQCNDAFDLINTSKWTERLVAINITDDLNNHLFHFDESSSSGANSYGYGTYSGIYINKNPNQDVFYLTGGAYLYHSSFIVKGNILASATGVSIFNVQGASGQSCPGAASNLYDIAVETAGPTYSVVRASNNGCTGGATGNAIVEGSGSIYAPGAASNTTSLIRAVENVPYLAGTLTTTASSSDTLTSSSNPTPASTCYVQPGNSAASAMTTGTYVSATNYGSVTVTHPAIAGALFQVWCAAL